MTKLSCWESQRFSTSARNLCFSDESKRLKWGRTSRRNVSSDSPAVAQVGKRFSCGVGLGAGVGGLAGADGSRFCIGDTIEEALVGVGRGMGLVLRYDPGAPGANSST